MVSSWVLAFMCCIWSFNAQVPVLSPQAKASLVQFEIKNFGLVTSGQMTGLSGRIVFHPNQLGSSSFQVSIPANSINTDNTMRDRHLRKPDYFSADRFPYITFVSNRVYKNQTGSRFVVSGLLTMKGISKNISFEFDAEPVGTGYRFEGSFGINRLDFGIGGNSLSLADQLEVQLDVTALAQ
jgi:polyisoprenoid-binding protein YceI